MPIGALADSAENADAMDVDASLEVQAPEPEQGPPPETTSKKKHKKAKEKAAKLDTEIDVNMDADTLTDSAPALAPVPPDLGLEPIATKVKKAKKAKKEGKETKEMTQDLSQLEPQAESTPLKVKSKKRKGLGDAETPLGVTPKKVKRTKVSTPLPPASGA